MKLLNLSLDSPEENLALDEALLEEAEAGRLHDDVLRIWEAASPAVIIGRSSRFRQEVDVDFCGQRSIPILRRCSGGAAVVIGPGCLMYSVVLAYARYPQLRMLDTAHRYVLDRVADAIRELVPDVRLQGTSDLAVHGCKVSGNSLRCKRDHLLYHGTLLCDFDLSLIGSALRDPPRQPDYREGRTHDDFVTNLNLSMHDLRESLEQAWDIDGDVQEFPQSRMHALVEERYSQPTWNQRL